MRSRRGHSGRRGSAMIEFAIVAMVLMLMVFAGFEIDRMILVYTAVANSAKAGVRYAIVHGSDRSGGSGADGESGGVDASRL